MLVTLGVLGPLRRIATSCALLAACAACHSSAPPVPGSALLAASILEHQYPALNDEIVQRYLEGVLVHLTQSSLTRRMVAQRGEPAFVSPRVAVAISKNAFALSLPSNTLLISTGILRSLANEAQLAFVLAHELSHTQLGHFRDFAERDLSPSQRKNLELAADARAVALIAAAGYDPRAALGALHQTDPQVNASANQPADPSETHPELVARQNAIIGLIEDSGWLPPGIVNRRDFVMVQQRLRSADHLSVKQ